MTDGFIAGLVAYAVGFAHAAWLIGFALWAADFSPPSLRHVLASKANNER